MNSDVFEEYLKEKEPQKKEKVIHGIQQSDCKLLTVLRQVTIL